jgi:NAD(P)-dependent dehydrogenase (short-subunit alcohol dehydrogenase family)
LTKALISDTGGIYESITEDHLFDMEFRPLQQVKVSQKELPLTGLTAIVTGSAGAIGRGISSALLRQGCNIALADLPGAPLNDQFAEYEKEWGNRVISAAMDVTDQNSVAAAFNDVIRRWGGLDIVIVNAGIAHVSSLVDMDLDMFRKLEKVNIDGTMLTLRESARLFSRQGCGGDIVLVSTKNVFAPGAGFGAYSATKAAAHQLARIAVVEMAGMGVRVNMVSPDAVFSHGNTKSGLWATVGPDRMKARGLDEKGLEEYYRSRNLLKASITAEHVANAVMFFVTRKTPTTGATIPVDGGLPDATPR